MEPPAIALHPPAPGPAALAPMATMDRERLREAARAFEAFFIARALEPMFAGVATEAPFGGGMAEELWRSLLVDEYGKAMARAGGIGLADSMVRSLIAMQETEPSLASDAPAIAAPPLDRPKTREINRP